ncbi:MAG: MotA/TolQ/ExbB proton channel family protein [Candidatus Omnitrophota bacterium]|nr:MotA/TolQ/ExbB proton channel family protein [Candidatus Omnitrophota bacterium]
MSFLTNILYWISAALLIPVIVILLMSLVGALLMLGGFYGLYMNRVRLKKEMNDFLEKLKIDALADTVFDRILGMNSLFSSYLRMMIDVNWQQVHSEKIITDFELRTEKELEVSKTLMRIGPMLGLMGTLIPMGPALVGLASGDIASMAVNMQVAFSTTVVGIFIGAIGYTTQLVKQRWFIEDLNNLQYIYELMGQGRKDLV